MPGLTLANVGFLGTSREYTTNMTYVGGYTLTLASVPTSTTIVLTSLSGGTNFAPSINDLVVVAYNASRNVDAGLSATGYTPVAEVYVDGGSDTNLYVGYKRLTSTDTQVVITNNTTGSTSQAVAAAIHVWRNTNATQLDVTSVVATTTGSRIPNPPAITPVNNGVVILAIGANAHGTTGARVPFTSTSLSNFISDYGSNTTNATIGMGSIVWGAEAYDPEIFGFAGGDSSSHTSAAVTLALRPA